MKNTTVKLRKKNTNKGISLYFDIYQNGVRKYEFLGIYLIGNKPQDKITLQTVEEIRIKKLAEMQRSKFGLVVESSITLENLINEVMETKKKIKTARNYATLLNRLENFNKSLLTKKLTYLNSHHIEQFIKHLTTFKNPNGKVLSSNSIREYLITLKSCFNYAVKKEYLIRNPMNKIDLPVYQEKEKDFLSISELKQLENIEVKPNQKESLRSFLLACYTGLRISDVKKLSYEDITENGLKAQMKKTGKFNYIPLSQKAKELISTKILNHSGLVFNLPSEPIINRHLKIIFKNAKINKSKVSFHMSRHTFATIALTIGIDLKTVSELLGHSHVSMTEIYAKIVNEKKVDAMNKFNQL